ncbi:PIN domain-like protein, partial [Ochromonadaceae sp. CCMP2298]
MGISDLLRNLQDVTTEMHISNFAGMRVAIDASGWMHKAVYATAEDWVDSNFADNQLYVDRLLNQVKSLQQCKVIPVMVFDGKRNTLKAETNEKRNEIKQSNIENARRLLESIGKTTDASARSKMRAECTKCFQGGLGVTHEMEKACIAGLQRCGVEVVVAPYEADPQLAYLCHVGHCDAVLTEDSDILVYSAVSGLAFPVLYKFNPSGSVQVTNLASCGILQATGKVGSPAGRPDSAEDISRAGRRMFVQMCLLSGCDYSDSIPTVGPQTACQIVARFRDTADDLRLRKICDYFKLSGKRVADTYLTRVLQAEQLFFYHPVYNPITDTLEHF